MNRAGELWWSSIAGPNGFLREICGHIDDGESVAAVISSAFPYRYDFRDMVFDRFSLGLTPEQIDSEEEFDGQDVGAWLVDRLDPAKRNAYDRCRNERDKLGVILKLEGLEKKLIWIRSIPDAHAGLWLEFLRRYLALPEHRGVFFLEFITEPPALERLALKRLRRLDYAPHISPSDLRLFSTLLAAGLYPGPEQEYACALATELCGTDPEIAERLLRDRDLCGTDAIERLREIYQAYREDGGYAVRGREDARHVFSILVRNDVLELNYRVWTAQLRTAFPIIELERQGIIKKFELPLGEALEHPYLNRRNGTPSYIMDEQGERIKNPYDLQIGNLAFMTTALRYDDRRRVLFDVDAAGKRRIEALHKARNLLAHLRCVPPAEFYPLLVSTPAGGGGA